MDAVIVGGNRCPFIMFSFLDGDQLLPIDYVSLFQRLSTDLPTDRVFFAQRVLNTSTVASVTAGARSHLRRDPPSAPAEILEDIPWAVDARDSDVAWR